MKKLNRHIKLTDTSNPDPTRLWNKIESGILIDGNYSEINRLHLENAIKKLEISDPERDLWPSISTRINLDGKKLDLPLLQKPFIRIAATIVFIICSSLIVRFLYSGINRNHLNALKKEPVESFLTYICTKYPKKCSDPDFIELRTEIIQLDNEKSEIENSIFFNPDDMATVRVNDRINNQIINLRDQIIEYVE